MRPIFAFPGSVNHRLRSGPVVMPEGRLPAVGRGNSVITPAGVIRPILFPVVSVNQRFPSGPGVITVGVDCPVGVGNAPKVNASELGTISKTMTRLTATTRNNLGFNMRPGPSSCLHGNSGDIIELLLLAITPSA